VGGVSVKERWVLVPLLLGLLMACQVRSEEKAPTYRLTIQIHDSPVPNSYYVFYFANIEFARENDTAQNRSIQILIPRAEEPMQAIWAYPPENGSAPTIVQQETDQGIMVNLTTDAQSCELRCYTVIQAIAGGTQGDYLLSFTAPRPESPVSGVTISINWPNWNYGIHRILPKGAERVENIMFETDPYKVISYYWYFPGSDVASRFPGLISVTLRTAAAISRVNRNQSILIFAVVVCVPFAIFVAIHPPKRGKPLERERKFRITEMKGEGKMVRRVRYKVK